MYSIANGALFNTFRRKHLAFPLKQLISSEAIHLTKHLEEVCLISTMMVHTAPGQILINASLYPFSGTIKDCALRTFGCTSAWNSLYFLLQPFTPMSAPQLSLEGKPRVSPHLFTCQAISAVTPRGLRQELDGYT